MELVDILCHRPPMILLDELLENGNDYLVAAVTIRPGIPFYRDPGGVPGWVGIEYMAQAIAALAGIRAKISGKPISLGLLIGCRNYSSTRAEFALGQRIEIRVEELASEDSGLASFDCSLSDSEIIAKARLFVFGRPRKQD